MGRLALAPSLAAGVLAGLAVAGCGASGGADAAVDFGRWGLPADLGAHLPHLETLELPPGVESLDWVPGSLHTLVLRGGTIEGGTDLPEGIVDLDLCNTAVGGPLALPGSLRLLDLRKAGLEALPALPSGLVSLAAGDPYLQRPSALPESIVSLSLEDTAWSTLPPLPDGLRRLALRMPRLQALPRLPPGLDVLVLANAQLTSLRQLPSGLDTLVLLRNATRLHNVEIPELLGRLVLDGVRVGAIRPMTEYLRSLEVNRSWLDSLEALPGSLETLELDAVTILDRQAPRLPASLRRLSLIQMQPLPALPRELDALELDVLPEALAPVGLTVRHLVLRADLESLEMVPGSVEHLELLSGGSLSLEGLPSGLRSLVVADAALGALPPLPDGLERLDLTGSTWEGSLPDLGGLPLVSLHLSRTPLTRLPELPGSLRTLDVSSTEVAELTGLPEGLETLVIAAGQIGDLAGLPATVKHLRVRPGTGVRACDEPLVAVHEGYP